MSEEKRAQLIADGKLRPDGSRIERCPTCTQEIPDELLETLGKLAGSAVGEAEATEVGVEILEIGAEDVEEMP